EPMGIATSSGSRFEFGWSVNQPYKKVKNYARGRSSTFNGEELTLTSFSVALWMFVWIGNPFCLSIVQRSARETL
ncbi:hypothetical protein M4D58_26945, partial [Brevibacillus borstelensis]|uniref:hypothetical protein n=1 Tax=Brevibacillus borstelensis TaxID=45462 RepID=UPI00203A97DD